MKVLYALLTILGCATGLLSHSSTAQAQSSPQNSASYIIVGCQTVDIVEGWLELLFHSNEGAVVPLVPIGCKPIYSNQQLKLDEHATLVKRWDNGINIYLFRIPTDDRSGYEDFYVFVPIAGNLT